MRTVTFNPETHQLVPKEPDQKMRNAGRRCISAEMVWSEMLAAAPQHEEREADGEVVSAHLDYATVKWLTQTSTKGGRDPKNSYSWPITGDKVYLSASQRAEGREQPDTGHRAECWPESPHHSPPPAQAEGQEAVAFLVKGWSEGKLIAKTLEHTADEARATAAVFAGHYPFIHTYALFTTPPRREWVGLTDEDKLAIRRMPWESVGDLIDNTEAKLKERNHG